MMSEFKCERCKKEFDRKESLAQHNTDKHGATDKIISSKKKREQRDETVKISNKVLVVVGLVLFVAVFIFLFANKTSTDTVTIQVNGTSTLMGEAIPIEGRTHVPEGTKVEYHNSNPPTSGNHWPQPAPWGFYEEPLPDEKLVHNIEHGGIWISHRDVDETTKSKIRAIAEKYPQAVIATPRPENDAKIAVASWGRLLKLDSPDEELIDKFIKSNINKAPEQLASLGQPSIKLGGAFLDFEVTEVAGRKITKESLQGKPAIVWFTTSWCVPCQIGAKRVVLLDDELGGNAFNVLVIFVDPRESESDLINWRNRFGNEDWMVAFDNFVDESRSLSAKVGLRYLDSKFLLDSNGIIKNIDFAIADEKYLTIIREVVKE